jgi:hypothetical protein
MTMNTPTTQRQATTTTTTSATSATPRSKRPRISGVLPYIGVILFLISIGWSAVTGSISGPGVLADAVAYLIGWAALGAGITHIVFGPRIARSIGFQPNDFQTEVGWANLAMGIAALLAPMFAAPYVLPVIIISSIFRVGAGSVHIRSMLRDRNFAVNNTAILGVNFLVPAFLVIAYLLWA